MKDIIRNRYISGAATTALVSILLTSQAHAQATGSDDTKLEDIVVTAQKGARGQSVQKVPLSITAVSPELLAQTRAADISDISKLAPNVRLSPASTQPGFANFTIRGIGVNNTTASSDPAVNVIVDGLVIDYPTGMLLNTFDLEGVEILRGPQGILQGKNSTGGAVSLRSARPTSAFAAGATLGVGNYGTYEGSVYVSGPISGDKLLGRIAILTRGNSGYFKNNGGGTFAPSSSSINPTGATPQSSYQDGPAINDIVIRPSLLWKATDNLDVTLISEFNWSNDGGSASTALNRGPSANWPTNYLGYTPPSGAFEMNTNFAGGTKIKSQRVVAEVNWRIPSGVITSITGYRHIDLGISLDLDGTPFTILHFPDNHQAQHQVSEELRYASDFSDVIKLVAGVFYDKNHFEVTEKRLYGGLLLGRPNDQYGYAKGVTRQDGESAAVFANFDVSPIPNLTLSAGGRYTWEKKTADITPITITCDSTYSNCAPGSAGGSKSWTNFSPRLGIQLQAARDFLLYASWTNGFRSGAYNQRASNLTPLQIGPVNPEKAESFEVGEKATFLDGHARLNVAGFYTKYTNMQRNILQGANIQYLANAASATIYGIEAEASIRPAKGWQFDGNFGWTHAAYDSFQGGNISWNKLIPNADLKLDHVPEFTYTVAGQYSFDLPDLGTTTTLRTSYSWTDSYFVDVGNTPWFAQGAVGMVDANLDIEKGSFKLSIYGKNLTNKRSWDIANSFPFPVYYGGKPRTFGAVLTYKY